MGVEDEEATFGILVVRWGLKCHGKEGTRGDPSAAL